MDDEDMGVCVLCGDEYLDLGLSEICDKCMEDDDYDEF